MQPRKFELKPAVRSHVPLLIGLIGPSGSGKTLSALRLATGIQRVSGGLIAGIDTESERMKAYADKFKFMHLNFTAPFGSLDYLEAIRYCVAQGAKVIVVDQMSSEHDGPGGVIDTQENELDKMAGDNYEKRERCKMLAWSKPKSNRRKLIAGLLQINCNFVFCFRAKSIVKPMKVNGKTEVVPQGFVPIAGDEFIYEMTTNIFLPPKSDGVPCWNSENPGEKVAMKLPMQFRGILDRPNQPLSEDIGEQLATWAKGGTTEKPKIDPPKPPDKPAELTTDDATYLSDVAIEVETARSVGDLTAIYKMVETKRPKLLQQVKELCGAKRKELEASA